MAMAGGRFWLRWRHGYADRPRPVVQEHRLPHLPQLVTVLVLLIHAPALSPSPPPASAQWRELPDLTRFKRAQAERLPVEIGPVRYCSRDGWPAGRPSQLAHPRKAQMFSWFVYGIGQIHLQQT